MTEKLFKQVDGSEWSWSNLNKVCMYVRTCMYVQYIRIIMQYLPYICIVHTVCLHTMYTCVQYVPVFMCTVCTSIHVYIPTVHVQ